MESSADMAGYANGWSGGEREQAAYVGMARQPMVLEPEADGPEQVGPQDDEKEREQAFPASATLGAALSDAAHRQTM